MMVSRLHRMVRLPRRRPTPRRRGFSLLEVMVAVAILVATAAILLEIQATSAQMTRDAQRIATATQLAQEKVTEVTLRLELEGFQEGDLCDRGNFRTFGDELMDLQFGDALEGYHYEWCVTDVDVGALSSPDVLMRMAQDAGLGGFPEEEEAPQTPDLDLSALGIGPDMIAETLSRYIRELRVEVQWAGDGRRDDEGRDGVELVSYVINPSGAVVETGAADAGQVPQ